jgi:hypothetical protein
MAVQGRIVAHLNSFGGAHNFSKQTTKGVQSNMTLNVIMKHTTKKNVSCSE